jgi:MFS family permease
VSPADPSSESATASAGIFAAAGRRLLVGIVSVIVLIAFEAMAVATVMPRAVTDLNGLAFYAWAFTGYVVASLFAMVVAGEMCDRSGPRLPLLGGVALFTVGLVLAGTAVDMGVFVLARALQGLGGGAVIVAIYVVVARAYDQSVRPRVFAVMSSAWVLPSIVGPAVAGFVADRLSWRWVFLAAAAFVVPAVGVMWGALPTVASGDGLRRPGRRGAAAMVAGGVACLQYAGQRLDAVGSLAAVVGLGLLLPSLHRLLPVGTLRLARGLPTVIAMRGVLAGAFFGTETFIPLMLVSQRHLSTTAAGLALTGGALGWAVGSWYQGRPATNAPRYRLVQAGCLLVAIAIGGIAAVTLAWVPTWLALMAWVVGGAGMGMSMASVSVLMLALSPRSEQGVNSAAMQVADALFSVVFIAIAGAVFAAAARRGGPQIWAFWVIDAVMAALALGGAVAAGRIRTRPTLPGGAPVRPAASGAS